MSFQSLPVYMCKVVSAVSNREQEDCHQHTTVNNLNAGALLTVTRVIKTNYYLDYRQRRILLHGHHPPNTTILQWHIPVLLQYKQR